MKIIGMVCMLNEEEFIDNFFKHNLPLVDKMIVAEGAVVGYPFCTKDCRSIDNTNSLLSQWKLVYPNKIEIVRVDRKWRSKQEQQNSMLKYVNDGDWCWIFGADEFYMPNDRKRLTDLLRKHPQVTEITWPTIHFFNDDKHMITNSEFNTPKMIRREQRFFKYEVKRAMIYINHPTINAMSPMNVDTFFHESCAETKLNLGMEKRFEKHKYRSDLIGIWDYSKESIIYRYHYGFIRNPLQRLYKHVYYLIRDRSMSFNEAIDFLMDKTDNNVNTIYGYINQIHQTRDIGISEFHGKHPLQGIQWRKSQINLEDIKKKYEDFNEIPRK